MSTPMFETPEHFPMAVTRDGQGPVDHDEAHHIACWCGRTTCVWTDALQRQRRMGISEGLRQAYDAVSAFIESCHQKSWPVTAGGLVRLVESWKDR